VPFSDSIKPAGSYIENGTTDETCNEGGIPLAANPSRALKLRNGQRSVEERRPLTVYDSVPGVGEIAVAVGVNGNAGSTAAGCLV